MIIYVNLLELQILIIKIRSHTAVYFNFLFYFYFSDVYFLIRLLCRKYIMPPKKKRKSYKFIFSHEWISHCPIRQSDCPIRCKNTYYSFYQYYMYLFSIFMPKIYQFTISIAFNLQFHRLLSLKIKCYKFLYPKTLGFQGGKL